MAGIQALERLEGVAPESRDFYRRREFEYIRHGTTTLMAATNVGKGNVAKHLLNPTRNEQDFVDFIESTVVEYPKKDKVVIIADQLNFTCQKH